MTKIIINEDEELNVDETSEVHITKNCVFINGHRAAPRATLLEIAIDGNLKSLSVDCGNVTMRGDVQGGIEVDCGNVSVDGIVSGNIRVDCGNIKVAR